MIEGLVSYGLDVARYICGGIDSVTGNAIGRFLIDEL